VALRDLVMRRSELNILLNHFNEEEHQHLWVHYPFFDMQLFRIDLEQPSISNVVTQEEFETERMRRKPYDKDYLASNLPYYNDLRNCFLSSRVEKYANEKKVLARLQELHEEIKDPNKRPRPLFIALDTNIFYARFLSRHLQSYNEFGVPTLWAEGFRYAISEMVQQEIDFQIIDKFKSEDIRDLKKNLAAGHYLDEFYNASARKARLAKMALAELVYAFSELRAVRIKGSLQGGDYTKNDIQIAQSYKDYSRRMDYDVLLLTADEDMIYHANSAELMAIQLILGTGIAPQTEVDPWSLQDLVYDLAVSFGVIEFAGLQTAVLGEWGGKSSEDYNDERVKVRFSNDKTAIEIERELKLSRRIADKIEGSKKESF
jgi:hypothetical protein